MRCVDVYVNVFVNYTATSDIYPYLHTLALHDALPILASLVRLDEGASARELNRTDRLRSVTVSASMAPGYTLDQALTYLDGVAAEVLPPEARITYAGQSREFKDRKSTRLNSSH